MVYFLLENNGPTGSVVVRLYMGNISVTSHGGSTVEHRTEEGQVSLSVVTWVRGESVHL